MGIFYNLRERIAIFWTFCGSFLGSKFGVYSSGVLGGSIPRGNGWKGILSYRVCSGYELGSGRMKEGGCMDRRFEVSAPFVPAQKGGHWV